MDNARYQRRGYMGYVTSLTGAIQLASQVNEELAQQLADCEEWQTYLGESYMPTQELQNKALGGVAGAESSEEEEPDQMVCRNFVYLHTLTQTQDPIPTHCKKRFRKRFSL